MNRLWIRIQHLPGPRDKESRRRIQRERNDLRILVGSNLNRLSSLEGVTARVYGSEILPRVLGEVAACRDPLSQAYLMDCVIQTFPDEYHLETLEVFLGVLPKLREKVNVRTILTNMMDRLVHYYRDDRIGEADDADASGVKAALAAQSFDMFEDIIGRVCEARGARIPPRDVVRLQLCLLNYATEISSDLGLVSRCIGNCAAALGTLQAAKAASMRGQGVVMGGGTESSLRIDMDDKATSALEEMLKVPLSAMGLDVLGMPDFAALLEFLPWENRRAVATELVKSLLESGKGVGSVAELEGLFGVISPLLRDEGVSGPAPAYQSQDGGVGGGGGLISRTANLMGTLGIHADDGGDDVFARPDHMAFAHDGLGGYHHGVGGGDGEDTARFREEQSLVARLVHLLRHDDTDVTYQLLVSARRHVQHGGGGRAKVTVPAVVFEALGLLRRVQELEFPEPPPEPAVQAAELDEGSGDGPGGQKDTPEEETPEEVEETKGGDEHEVKRPEAETAEEPAATGEDEQPSTGDETKMEEAKVPEGAADASAGGSEESPETDANDADAKGEGSESEIPKDGPAVAPPAVAPPPVPEPSSLFVAEFTKSVNCRKILVFLQKSVAMLAPSNPELALKLYLEIAVATDGLARSTAGRHEKSSAEQTSIAYDFLTQAFLVYDDEISDPAAQVRSITSIVGSLLACETFEDADYEALITKTAQFSAKLLKKPDQCRMVCLCSRLFYVGGEGGASRYRNPQRVLECLQRGLKIADSCTASSPSHVQLFVEIFDYYVHYFEIGTPSITDKFVSGLIALINEHFASIGATSSTTIAESRAYFEQILDTIRRRKVDESSKDRFGVIVC